MAKDKDALGDRMKQYEAVTASTRFLPLLPICVRIDGKNFSKFTARMERPFDMKFHACMCEVTKRLVEASHAVIGYTQSDEISLVLYSATLDSQLFFDGKQQKLVSVLASMATRFFVTALLKYYPEYAAKEAFFDARAWVVPSREEAVNVLIWRELDATKNSVSMAARHYFSHKELHGLGRADQMELLFSKGVNWNDYPTSFKRGTYFRRVTTLKPFSREELDSLPPKHNARKNPGLLIERTLVEQQEVLPLKNLTNRVGFVFGGEPPKIRGEAPVDSVEACLNGCVTTFRNYADIHAAKLKNNPANSEEIQAKVDANTQMADLCERALARWRVGNV